MACGLLEIIQRNVGNMVVVTADQILKHRKKIEQKTGYKLELPLPEKPESLEGLIENCVGMMPVPQAVVGPLRINGSFANGSFYVPLCTVEGTLAASMARGLMMSAYSGGINTQYIKQEVSRSPIFVLKDLAHIHHFIQWIKDHFTRIKSCVESTSRFAKLLRIDPIPNHLGVILDFVYTTGDASGQNMTTFATAAACKYILDFLPREINFDRYFIESNFSGDKTACARNFTKGRGHHVIAHCAIPNKMLKRAARVTVAEMVGIGRSTMQAGSIYAGIVGGVQLHLSNALTALYLALGQDPAAVAENAIGHYDYTAEQAADGEVLRCVLTLPSLTVGTVGGATSLPHIQKNLGLIDCAGAGKAKNLAEIIAACSLALEMSLSFAIASREFSEAHQKYGRAKSKITQDIEVSKVVAEEQGDRTDQSIPNKVSSNAS